MSSSSDLGDLLDNHRVVVCVGAGGVGKTTVAAALALSAAQAGKRTLCLTIDPARRLASCLGLSSFPREEMRISRDFLRDHGIELPGELTVMMLHPRATFDGLIERFAESRNDALKILEHRVYQHLAENLGGTQAYMAMEKVLSVMKSAKYDVIILDTPPSARALDFFDAPMKMTRILDSPATRALVRALAEGRQLRFNLIGAGLRAGLRGIERITGGHLLSEMAELLAAMNGLFGGFEERARAVDEILKSEEFGYLLVTAPKRRTIRDALGLSEQMAARGLRIGAVVLNRTAFQEASNFEEILAHSSQGLDHLAISDQGKRTAVELTLQASKQKRLEDELCQPLLSEFGRGVRVVRIPASSQDVHQPARLKAISALLTPEVPQQTG